jgi:hypothetical protein
MAKVHIEYSETYTEIYHSIGFQRSFCRTLKMDGDKEDLLEIMPLAFRSLPSMEIPALDSRNEVLRALLKDLGHERNKFLLE